MGDLIEYQGSSLGTLHYNLKEGWILEMQNVGTLETLLKLQPSDIITVEGHEEPYERFRKEIIEKTKIIYTSTEAFVRNEFPFPFGRKVPEDIAKKAGL